MLALYIYINTIDDNQSVVLTRLGGLGSTDRYFNYRLVQAIDALLAAPKQTTPIRLVQPMLLYAFADATLETRSAGQKIMLRMGRDRAVTVKAKLREIRRLMASDAG